MNCDPLETLRNLSYSHQRLREMNAVRDGILRRLECVEKEIFEEKVRMSQLFEEFEKCQN